MLFCASKIQNRSDCFLWNIDNIFDKTIVASNFIDIDDTASTELTRYNRPFCTREEKIILREKNVIAVTRSCRFQHDQRSRQQGVEFAVQVN